MIIQGDMRVVLPTMQARSFDACITDPPYELGFMGKPWDRSGVSYQTDTWAHVFRVLKPGAHLVAFGGTRTFHRIAVAIENAGFEIRDCLSWLYGSGFPKSLDVSKAIDAAAGVEREVIGRNISAANRANKIRRGVNPFDVSLADGAFSHPERIGEITAPTTDAAKQWHGWGTALKPAWEPIILARKPLSGTVAANVQQYGTGAINVDACRIGTSKDVPASMPKDRRGHGIYGAFATHGGGDGQDPNVGRWPANVILDEAAAVMLDQQSGELHNQDPSTRGGSVGSGIFGVRTPSANYSDRGGASRFYYVAKASKSERNAGCADQNTHPTVKPIKLMQWLVRMVTPPGGIVIDPFFGSGTTGIACVLENRQFTGIELDVSSVETAQQRIKEWRKQCENS